MVSVEEFVSQYSSENTKRTYRIFLKRFFRTRYPDLDINEASIQYLDSGIDFKADMVKFRDSVANLAPKTRLSTLTVLFRFLEENEIDFPKSFKRNLIGKETESVSEEHIPNPTEIERIMHYLPIIGQGIVMVLSSSGMRPGECLQIKLADLDLDKDPPRINLPSSITKTKKKRLTFISQEAKAVLLEWLTFRETHQEITMRRAGKRIQSERVFPITQNSFLKLWGRALRNAQMGQQDKRTHRHNFHPHNLRKFFKTYSSFQNPEVGECLMGHLSGVRNVYGRYQDAESELEKAYKEVEPRISIFQHSKFVSELKQTVEKQSSDIDTLVKNTAIKNAKLENALDEQEKKHTDELNKVWAVVGKLSEIVSDPEMARKVSEGVAEFQKKKKDNR